MFGALMFGALQCPILKLPWRIKLNEARREMRVFASLTGSMESNGTDLNLMG